MKCLQQSLKTTAILLLASTSLTSYADTIISSPVSPMNVTIPMLAPGFEINAGAVWLKPGASNLNYVIFNKADDPAQTPLWTERELKPSYSTGFQLGMRYILPNRGQDVSANWTHLYTNDSGSTNAPSAAFFLGPDYQIGPEGIDIRNATGRAKFRYDVVNLDAGQYVNFGPCLTMRFFGGLSGAFLREQVIARFTGESTAPFAGPFSTRQNSYSNFTGVGPRAGSSVEYSTNMGFGFIGEAAASALIGSNYAKTTFRSSAPELLALFGQSVNNQFIKDQRVYQVVPGFDAKLGLNYKYNFHDALFTVSAGYQGAVYVNAISQYLPQSLVEGEPMQTGGIFVATMAHHLSNYSVHGPFLNFAVKIC